MAEPTAGAGTGELNVQSVDLTECKELNQPVPLQATLCRKGVYAILKDCPCKVSTAHYATHITADFPPGELQRWEYVEDADEVGAMPTESTPRHHEPSFHSSPRPSSAACATDHYPPVLVPSALSASSSSS